MELGLFGANAKGSKKYLAEFVVDNCIFGVGQRKAHGVPSSDASETCDEPRRGEMRKPPRSGCLANCLLLIVANIEYWKKKGISR